MLPVRTFGRKNAFPEQFCNKLGPRRNYRPAFKIGDHDRFEILGVDGVDNGVSKDMASVGVSMLSEELVYSLSEAMVEDVTSILEDKIQSLQTENVWVR